MVKQYIKKRVDGSTSYYKDPGKTILHREDGPAYVTSDGEYKAWWLNGERHRLDGPAVRYGDGTDQWYVNGEFIFETDKRGKILDRMEEGK